MTLSPSACAQRSPGRASEPPLLRATLRRCAPSDCRCSGGGADRRSTDRPEPGVILTVRRENLRTHAGQIAFPGGRLDPGEDGGRRGAARGP